MQKFSDVVLDKNGKAVQGAAVAVVTYPDGWPATIYAADGGPSVDSVKTDQYGRFAFYAANGHYSVTVSGTGITPVTYNDVTLFDPGVLASNSGASLVGFQQSGAGAAARRAQDKLRERVSVKDFGAVGDGTDATAAFQAAAAYMLTRGGGRCYIPGGVYLVKASIKTGNNVTFYGDGDSSQLLVNTDIEVFVSDTTTPSSAVFRAEFRDFFINNTVAGARTKYDIHLQNPCICKFDGVHIASGHGDTAYSATNVGGIFLDKPDASTSASYMNRIKDCWIERNSIYCKNVTDTTVTGGFVWGHVRQFAIRFQGGGANAVEKVEGIIASQFCGGIWLDGAGINQMRIHGNEFDGNPALITGTGVYAPASTISLSITGNTFWGCAKHGIDVTDPIGMSVSGNSFWKSNFADGGYDDVRITGKTFQPNGNVVSGNSHVIDTVRANPGCAIREVNSGFNPVNNTYTGNGVQGQGYMSPAILTLSAASVIGNVGKGVENLGQQPGNMLKLGGSAIVANLTEDVAAGAFVDLVITPSGYVGTLNVGVARGNFPIQSRRALYAAFAYGTTSNMQLIAGQDGSDVTVPTFTLTTPVAGAIRLTNTTANTLAVRMSFFGNAALG
jgi:hypothetical protein